MSIALVNITQFNESRQPMFGGDSFNMATMTREFIGPVELEQAFLQRWKVTTPDTEFPNFALSEPPSSTDFGAGLKQVTLTFVGMPGADLPQPIVRKGSSLETAQVGLMPNFGSYQSFGAIFTGIGNQPLYTGAQIQGSQVIANTPTGLRPIPMADLLITNGALTITYRSPWTEFRYVSKKEPVERKYKEKLMFTQGDFEILDLRPTNFIGRPVINSVVREVDFQAERAGRHWHCIERNQGMLMSLPASLKGILAQVQISGQKPKVYNVT
jgi:hypothetical protein